MPGETAQLKQKKPQSNKRWSAKGEKRYEEILTAAMDVFSRDGYENASFASIAAEVGLTLPGLLHYFPTKVDLLLAVLTRRDAEWIGEDVSVPDNWRELLERNLDIVRYNMRITQVVRAFAILNGESLIENHPASDWYVKREADTRKVMAAALEKGIAAGEVRPDIDPLGIAAEVVGVWDGVQSQWLRNPDAVDIEGVLHAYTQRLLAYLAV